MDILVELEQETDLDLLVGRFADLEYLVNLLNGVWESIEFRLDAIQGKNSHYIFVQDDKAGDHVEVGILEKRGGDIYAFTPAVHALVMNAYERYVSEFGTV